MTADMMKCYMMRMYEVKPDCRDMWKMYFPQCKMMWEKHGAKCMGQWQVCLGGSSMFMMMMEFPNTMAAMKCQTDIRMDPEHSHMISMCYKCVDKITCPIMKCMPMMPMCMPNEKSNMIMMRFTLRTMPCMAMKECQMFCEKFCERFCKPCGMKMIGCFVPCYTMTCNAVYMMMEMPMENTNACMTKMDEFCTMMCTDAGWCETMMPFYNCCSGYSMKMMNSTMCGMNPMMCGMGGMMKDTTMMPGMKDTTMGGMKDPMMCGMGGMKDNTCM